MKVLKWSLGIALVVALLVLAGCSRANHSASNKDGGKVTKEVSVVLSDNGITVDGQAIGSSGAVYSAHDIIYYEDRDTYESGNPYGEGTADDRHTAEEAEKHTVVHITQPGFYRISGKLSAGQMFVDLGEEAETDASALVTLILDDVDITCTVAPAVFFYRVYECADKEEDTRGDTDLSLAGARVVLADGSNNVVNGHRGGIGGRSRRADRPANLLERHSPRLYQRGYQGRGDLRPFPAQSGLRHGAPVWQGGHSVRLLCGF